MEKKELELIDYLNILWKRKWIIIIGTLLCMIITGIVSFIIKPVYEVDAIIQPGKFFVEDQSGNIEEIVVETPEQIANKVIHKSYNAVIAAQLNVREEQLPRFRAENIRDTLLTRIWVNEEDISLGKRILQSLLEFIKEEMDEKIEVEFNNIDAKIKANEIERERRIREIQILNKRLKIIDQRKKDITAEIKSVRDKINELEKEQLTVLRKENRSDIESLGLLLYSNEIQQSLQYYDILNEKLSEERLQEEDVHSSVQEEEATISKIDNMIANLKERKGRIDRAKIIKEPASSISPVYPKKKLSILIAGILSFMVFTILAFFFDYIKKAK